jgi:hypothetical protein
MDREYLKAPVIARDEMVAMQNDAEQKYDLVSLDYLQERRRVLMRRFAPLKAKYGPFGSAEAQHKSLEGAIALSIDHPYDETDEDDIPRPLKLTEETRKSWMRSHPKVKRNLAKIEEGKTEYLLAEVELTEIEEQIKNREILAGLLKGELYLTK